MKVGMIKIWEVDKYENIWYKHMVLSYFIRF